MELAGAIFSFFVCFIAGCAALGKVVGAGERHRASRVHPTVRPCLGAMNIAFACFAAWGGYLLVQAYWR